LFIFLRSIGENFSFLNLRLKFISKEDVVEQIEKNPVGG
jgi:hypothetical protein